MLNLSNLFKYIELNFGSKRGLIRHIKYYVLYRLGVFHKYSLARLDFKPKRLVFVCAGNICRSPLAAAVAKKLGVESCSFGLDTRGGDPADPRAIRYGALHGFDLENHVTKTTSDYVEQSGDLVVVMEPKHIHLYKKADLKTPLILLGLTSAINRNPYIHDPYNTRSKFFDKTEELIVLKSQYLGRYVQR